jgi:hypothetical protein
MTRSAEVDAYMATLQHPMSAQVQQLRSVILDADSRVRESIKWNAPSFFIDDHFATFNLHHPDRIQIVLHAGAKVNPDATQFEIADPSGLLTWAAVDRASVTFASAADVDDHLAAFVDILHQWIALTTVIPSP